jgi:hypothetical protein
MARETKMPYDFVTGEPINLEKLKAFEALVRADERDRAMRENAYVQAEREACAVIAETPISGEQDDVTMQAKDRVAEAIRARGNT